MARTPNRQAIQSARTRAELSDPAALRSLLRSVRADLQKLEVFMKDAPADLLPPSPRQSAGTLRGAARVMEKWLKWLDRWSR